MKILGTTINVSMDWNDHINFGSGSLMHQLKQRFNSIKLIAKTITLKFAKQIANAILMSKIYYNVEIWGDTNRTNKNKIDRIINNTARIVLGKKAIGRTDEWTRNKLNWMNISQIYEHAMQKSIYKILNEDENHEFQDYLTKNRNIRMESQNKVGHHDQNMGRSSFTQKTFLYRAVECYNKLPKEITLIKSKNNFKKWSKNFNINNKIKLKSQTDNILIIEKQLVDENIISRCYDDNDL